MSEDTKYTDREELCINCRFWESNMGRRARYPEDEAVFKSSSDCRRYAPQPRSMADLCDVWASWPLTCSGEWCAEFEPCYPQASKDRP